MPTVNESKVQADVRGVLTENSDILESGTYNPATREVIHTGDIVDFYFPKRLSRGIVDGFKLVSDKGFISFHETYRKINQHDLERIGYVYKYVTNEMVYSCTHIQSGKLEKINYNFHYDMDLRRVADDVEENHPATHLQVLHTHPRFDTSKETTAAEFLQFVRIFCYENKEASRPYTEALFLRN